MSSYLITALVGGIPASFVKLTSTKERMKFS